MSPALPVINVTDLGPQEELKEEENSPQNAAEDHMEIEENNDHTPSAEIRDVADLTPSDTDSEVSSEENKDGVIDVVGLRQAMKRQATISP